MLPVRLVGYSLLCFWRRWFCSASCQPREGKAETRGSKSEIPQSGTKAEWRLQKPQPLWYSHDPFPLTPALSLREREHRRQRIREADPLRIVATPPGLSLSLRERAG